MQWYLAAKYDKRADLLLIADRLRAAGHEVGAAWLTGAHECDDAFACQWARQDLADIAACDSFMLVNLPLDAPDASPGRHVEFGYALALKKPCIVIGGGSQSIFYRLAKHFTSIEEFFAFDAVE